MKFSSLRDKLIVWFIFIIFVTVSSIGIAISIYSNQSATRQYNEAARQQINTIDQALALFYDDLDRNIDMMAEHSFVKQSNRTITPYYDKQNISMMTPSKNGGIEQEIFEIFELYGRTHPGTLYVYMGTEDGGYIQWPETGNSNNYDPRIRPWYTIAINENGKVFRTDPYKDSVTNSLIVSNARSFKDSTGKVYGAVAIDVSPEKLTDILQNVQIGETGYAMMIHRTGLVLADSKYPENNLKHVSELPIEGFEKVLESESSFYSLIEGKDYLINSKKSDKTDWIVVTAVEKNEVLKNASAMRRITAIISLIVIAIGVFIAVSIALSITNPIKKISNTLAIIAKKDFSVSVDEKLIKEKDEIGLLSRSVDALLQEISKVICDVKKSTETVANSSNNLVSISNENSNAIEETAKAIETLALRTSDQASESRNISNVLNHVEKRIDSMTEEIDATNKIAYTTMDKSEQAIKEMKKLEESKKMSLEKTESITQIINRINDNANNAQEFTKAIEGISNQTNLLALNASIEAARAGDAVKGFAVVAEEIRKLSQETTKATLDINSLIESINSESQNAVSEIKLVNDLFNALSHAINQSEFQFNDTVSSLKNLSSYINSLSNHSIELNEEKRKMLSGMSSIVAGIDDNSAISEEISASIEEETASMIQLNNLAYDLLKLAEKLNEEVDEFKLN